MRRASTGPAAQSQRATALGDEKEVPSAWEEHLVEVSASKLQCAAIQPQSCSTFGSVAAVVGVVLGGGFSSSSSSSPRLPEGQRDAA